MSTPCLQSVYMMSTLCINHICTLSTVNLHFVYHLSIFLTNPIYTLSTVNLPFISTCGKYQGQNGKTVPLQGIRSGQNEYSAPKELSTYRRQIYACKLKRISSLIKFLIFNIFGGVSYYETNISLLFRMKKL